MKKTLLKFAVVLALPAMALGQDNAAVEALQKQLESLQKQVDTLKEQVLDSGSIPAVGAQMTDESEKSWAMKQYIGSLSAGSPSGWAAGPRIGSTGNGLRVGLYGESKYKWRNDGANTADAHRYVLTPSYVINDWLIFNSELELEHGAVADGSTRFDGELEIEQFYVDALINDYVNIRSPGIGLIPMGRVNLIHEPTTFYSTDRPRLYREIIPSTWFEPMLLGAYGKVTDTLDYQFFVTTGLEDLGVGSGPSGSGGVRGARPRLRRASENSLAYSGRLHYSGIPGLDASASFYATKIRGAGNKASSALAWDVEALYRVPKTGLELRGDFAMWHFEDPEVFIANRVAGTAVDPALGAGVSSPHDVGKRMFGYHFEAAYHFWPDAWRKGIGIEMDLVPFARYTHIDTQDGMPDGFLDTGNKEKYLTMGAAWFLNPNVVLKGDMRRRVDRGDNDQYQVAVGVFF